MYLAHISEDGLRKQSILEHSEKTAELAGKFAEDFDCGEWGYGCGLLHDIGKYSERFQKRIHNHGGFRTDHATAGAQELYHCKKYMGAYCIAGHHSGLPDGGTIGDSAGEATFQGRMKKQVEDYQVFRQEIPIPEFPNPPLRTLGKGGFNLSFFIRMLYSSLVDADSLDAEAFATENGAKRGGYESIEVLYERLCHHMEPWLKNEDLETVNGRRTLILKACLNRGEDQQGIFRLTVPTGGGKTISSLAFALKHARKHQLKRIIYVIPYTSIIEQNARIFKEVLGPGNVLEDHCNAVWENPENPEELAWSQLAAENWDVPVVVTTNVQFFESLFSNRRTKCRKIHNLAKSVILFDEAQMLPVPYLKPCIRAISELIYNYHCSAVLCTATQPSLQQFFPEQIKAVEICPDVEEQYEFFRRTQLRKLGEVTEEQLREMLQGEPQALCIFNSRRRVRRVYEMLQGEGTYHLSTFMYPDHRSRVLQEIKERLKEGKSCRLIATSLVEAGVDFDFPAVYRELAGVDSVIQAAGRCNREGKKAARECLTYVFTMPPEEGIHLPTELRLPIQVAKQVVRQYEDISSLPAIGEYFQQLYYFKGESLDKNDIVEQLEKGARSLLFPFATVAKQFRLIESNTKTILIDKEPEAAKIAERIRRGEHSRQLYREAGHYCVNVYENDFSALQGAGKLEQIEMEMYVLRDKKQYTKDRGLVINEERGDGVFV